MAVTYEPVVISRRSRSGTADYPMAFFRHPDGSLVLVVLRFSAEIGTTSDLIKYVSADNGSTWSSYLLHHFDFFLGRNAAAQRSKNTAVMDPNGRLHITLTAWFNGTQPAGGQGNKLIEVDELDDGSIQVIVNDDGSNRNIWGTPDTTPPVITSVGIAGGFEERYWYNTQGFHFVPMEIVASDDVGITGYLCVYGQFQSVNDPPPLDHEAWVETKPSALPTDATGIYLVYNQDPTYMSKSFWLWVKDAGGNRTGQQVVFLTGAEKAAPQTISFNFTYPNDPETPSTYPALAWAASDTGDSGICAYLLHEDDKVDLPYGTPALDDPRWISIPVTNNWSVSTGYSYTPSEGSKTGRRVTLYVKDRAGNISMGNSAAVLDYNTPGYPWVSHFDLAPDFMTGGPVATITAFSAESTVQDVTITGYMVTEELRSIAQGTVPQYAVPTLDDPRWSENPPAAYTLSGGLGQYYLIPWVKSSDGKISTPTRWDRTDMPSTPARMHYYDRVS